MDKKRVTVPEIGRMKGAGERITMVTAYDWTFARLLDEAGVDMLLVGDSLGMVVQGHDTTLPVTLDEMVYHTRMVARGARARWSSATCRSGATRARPIRRCRARSGSSRTAARTA
jgi:3-methyl-2-oxobutanoate hydroxymethyltransferase